MSINIVIRSILGLATIALIGLQPARAGLPIVPTAPLPGRNFPTEEELRTLLEPQPLKPIPDDPPPHEGAMINLPYVVMPPDLVVVEVLGALPGRPISGERLVRPDGTIDLGFYGAIQVRGLTLEQIKTKLVLHLRRTLTDDFLGLYRVIQGGEDMAEPAGEPDQAAPAPAGGAPSAPSQLEGRQPPARRAVPMGVLPRSSPGAGARPSARIRRLASAGTDQGPGARQGEESPPEHRSGPSSPPSVPRRHEALVMAIHPADSDSVFVDVSAYNSQAYYVQGDVASPGRMPYTGNETVLDAVNYAGGFIATAETKDIRLVRPARGGKPTRVYRVDWAAIFEKGDARANYQLFPGDRLIVGRNDAVKKTIEIDRLAMPLQSVMSNLHQYNAALGTLRYFTDPASGGKALTPSQREELIKDWVDFWWKAATRPGGVTLDETTFQEALMRHLKSGGDAPKDPPK